LKRRKEKNIDEQIEKEKVFRCEKYKRMSNNIDSVNCNEDALHTITMKTMWNNTD